MTTKTAKKTTTKSKSLPELPRMPFAFEVLNLASTQRAKAKKVEVLQKYGDLSLKMILKWNFDTSIVSILPEGEVPYTPNTDKTGHAKLMTKIPQIEKLVCNHSTKMGVSDTTAQFKREKMFIDILESVDEKEAEVLIAAKDKTIHRKYVISDNVVREAFGWTKDYVREPDKGGSKTWAP